MINFMYNDVVSRFSGIKAEDLEGVKTSIFQVQVYYLYIHSEISRFTG